MTDNKESISDKLRRWADESEDERSAHGYPSIVARTELGMVYGTPSDEERELFRLIADEVDAELESAKATDKTNLDSVFAEWIEKMSKGERDFPAMRTVIERWYLPRPLFEDGEPVQSSDIEEIGGLATCCVYTDGSWRFDPDKFEDEGNPKPCDKQQGRQSDRIKRPIKVLDADGVPIEVGDKVWWIDSDGGFHECTVTSIEPLSPTHQNRYPDADFMINTNPGSWMPNTCITHREPDSQERIDADVPKTVCKYFGASGKPCDECPIHGSKIGCSNEKMRDLLRRQRELDGRDA